MQDMRIAEPETRGKDARHKKCRAELETVATGPGLVLGGGCGTVKQQQSAQVPRRNTGTVLVTGFLLPFLVLVRIVAELE